MILTSGQMKYYMEEVVRFQHYLKINFRIMFASAILAGFFFLIAIGLNSFPIFGALSGISLAVLITSFIVRSDKCIDYDVDTESKNIFMQRCLDYEEYQALKKETEEFLGYRKNKNENSSKIDKIKIIKTQKLLNNDFLKALEDFYYLDLEQQENVILSLKGDQKIQDNLKSVFKRLQVGYDTRTLIQLLQCIKSKIIY